MDFRDTVIQVLQADDPAAALAVVARDFPFGPGRLAVWVGPDGEAVRAWPSGASISPALAADALAAAAPLVRPLTPGYPDDAAEHPGHAALLAPSPDRGEGAGALVVVVPATDAAPAGFDRVVAAVATVCARRAREQALLGERDTFRRRAEESEALHVMGLAANRTLDKGEVLRLVARFTRTLLGAHYVTVNTLQEGRIRTAAAAGLLEGGTEADDPFAARVAEAGKPLRMAAADHGGPDEPFHARQGMRVGLGVPLSLFGDTFGALVIAYRRPYEITPRDTRLALTLAGHAAVAISNARLHGELAARSAELEQANHELLWTAQAKDRFFASVSHELRTPLNAILGFHHLLMEDVPVALAPQARDFVARAHRNTQSLLGLVNDVLDLSKLAVGKMELDVRPMAPFAVVEEAASTIEPLFRQKGLTLRCVPPESALPAIRSDPERVRQIVVNLLANAVKFTERGEVVVSVHGVNGGDGPRLEIRVTDTGRGIAPEHHERIFQEFEQVGGVGMLGGTGLGLPISRKLARLLGGDLAVESEAGSGATFVLWLPAGGDGG